MYLDWDWDFISLASTLFMWAKPGSVHALSRVKGSQAVNTSSVVRLARVVILTSFPPSR